MSELMFILFVISVGVLIFTSIQSILIANAKLSFVCLALTFLSISVCFIVVGWYFTSFSTLFLMFINQYFFKYLAEKEPEQCTSTDIDNIETDEPTNSQNLVQNIKENNVASDKQTINLLISIGIFILLSGFTLYLSFSELKPPKNSDTQIAQNLNLLWFAVFAVLLGIVYLVLKLLAQSSSDADN